MSLTPVYIIYQSKYIYMYIYGCSYVCINSVELGTYCIGGLRLPRIQAAELGLSSTQADGMTIIAWIR